MVENKILEHVITDEKEFVKIFLEKVEDESNILFINLNRWCILSTFQHIIKKKSIKISVIFQPSSNKYDIKKIQKNIVGEELEKNINYYNNLKDCYEGKFSVNNNIKFHYAYFLHIYSFENFENNSKYIRELCFPVSIWKINLFLTKDMMKGNKSAIVKYLEPEHPFLETIDFLKSSLKEFINNQKVDETIKTSYLLIGEKTRYHIEFIIDQNKIYKDRLVDII